MPWFIMLREKIKKEIKTVFLLSILCFLFSAFFAQAASLYFSPSSGSYATGEQFLAVVYVSSADQAMNAASGVISFPQDKLEVVSLSKSASIFSLWVQEPSFSNNAGAINFEGIVLNPGFTGSGAKIITINFKVRAAGNAPLNFVSGSVLANDGKGTNILASLGSAQFSLGGATPTIPESESTTPSVVSGAPSAPKISSSTHPDSNKWYAKKDAKFTWPVPSGVTGIRLLVGKIPVATPTVTYKSAINEKEITDLADGIWYFHAQFRNANGWGEISHFRFQIDTQPPEPFFIKFIGGNETDNLQPTALFDTTDSLSGIDYYKIKIGEGDIFPVSAEIVKSNLYTLPLQMPGKRNILVQAFDRAGNFTITSTEFTILPPPSTLVKVSAGLTKFLAAVIPLVALIILLILTLVYGWHKLSLFKKKVRKETKETKEALHQAFNALKEETEEQVAKLDGKPDLSEREKKICNNLKKALKISEEFIGKEIEDIEKIL